MDKDTLILLAVAGVAFFMLRPAPVAPAPVPAPRAAQSIANGIGSAVGSIVGGIVEIVETATSGGSNQNQNG